MNTRRSLLLYFLVAVSLATRVHGQTVHGLTYLNGGIIRGPLDKKNIAIVFTGHEFADGGETILNALAAHYARASFFLTGDFLANTNFAPLVRRIVKDGHYLGPHSDKHLLYCAWDDTNNTLVTRADFESDLDNNLKKIEAFGVPGKQVRYFLPAYEQYNSQIAQWASDKGLVLVSFTPGTRSNADYASEADSNFVSSKAIFESILAREQQDPNGLNGFLLLFHVGSGPARADKFTPLFGRLLDTLGARGYHFVRVDQLLATI